MARGRKSSKTNTSQGYWIPILIILILASSFQKFWWVWIPVVILSLCDWYSRSKHASRIQASISQVDQMDGTQFEYFLVRLFTSLGYAATHTGQSGDFGADLIVEGRDGKIAVQAKNYDTSNVGNKAVQEAIAAASYYKCHAAMVVTNSHYTSAAIKQAQGSNPPVRLIDREDLEELLARAR